MQIFRFGTVFLLLVALLLPTFLNAHIRESTPIALSKGFFALSDANTVKDSTTAIAEKTIAGSTAKSEFNTVGGGPAAGEFSKNESGAPRRFFPPKDLPAPPVTSAEAMVLLDLTSNVFLAESNAEKQLPMASTTKIMTGLLTAERCDLDETLTVPPEAVGIEGSSVYLFAGERISVRTLLYALLLSSANDAAHLLALHIAGSIESFALLMNERARELNAFNTCFQNPHGLPAEGHYTTARDLALIAAAAMENPIFREVVSTTRYSAPQEGTDATRLFLNHNRLLRTYEGAIGVKTGFTKAAGRCLVSAAERDGLTLLAVMLNDPADWRDAAALFDYGFSHFTAFSGDGEAVELPVSGGNSPTVTLTPEEFRITIPKAHGEIQKKILAPRFLIGGCAAGDEIGAIVYTMDDEIIAKLPLIADHSVDPVRPDSSIFGKIRRFFWKII